MTTRVSAANALFLNATDGGIVGASQSGTPVVGVGTELTGSAASSFVPSGAIDIAAGASITTSANGTQSDGGFVLIAAPNINNAGTISTPNGQAILAAGIGVTLLKNISAASAQLLVPELTGRINVNGVDVTPVGSLINTGLVQATTGNVTLLGTNVTQAGVVEVTTSVSVPGSVTISTVDEADLNDSISSPPVDRRAGQLIVSGVIADLAEENGQTVPSDGGTFIPGSLSLTGGSVWLQTGSLIEATGASVSVAALTPQGSIATQPPGDNGRAGAGSMSTMAPRSMSPASPTCNCRSRISW